MKLNMKNRTILQKMVLGGICLTSMLSLISCDPLGMEPTTMVDQDRFWLNPQLTREYVNNFYTWTPLASGQSFQSEQWSDNCQGNSEKDWNTYNQWPFNYRRYDIDTSISSFDTGKAWEDSYKHLRAINLGIERISTSNVITETIKNQLLGECYFFRAWQYFDMEKYWGTVPYVDKSLSITDETFLPRIKREKLFDNMLDDLTKAAEYFKAFGGAPSRGMVDANTVTAFRSRVALAAACAAQAAKTGLYSFDDKDGLFSFEKTASHYYQIAYDASYSLIGKYSLETDYADLFTSPNAYKSTESIWAVMFNKANRGGFNPTAVNGPDGLYYENSSTITLEWKRRSGLFPTQDLVDCYLQQDEEDGKWKKWWETKQAKDLGVVVDANGKINGTSADYRKMFEGRDKRFYSTVTYDGAYMGPSELKYQIQTWIDTTQPADGTKTTFKYSALHSGYRAMDNMNSTPGGRGSAQTITGYYSRKYSFFDQFDSDGALNGDQRTTCYFNIRYAEVLLNCAEAGIQLAKGDARGYINDIRNRAGLDAYTGNDLMEELKLQRRLEFAFECPGFRYFDLLRWAEADGLTTIPELNRPSKGLWIFRKGVESELAGKNGYPMQPTEEGYFVPHFETAAMDYTDYQRKFDHPRFYFMPFSQTTISTYTGLTQNPGWTGYRYTN